MLMFTSKFSQSTISNDELMIDHIRLIDECSDFDNKHDKLMNESAVNSSVLDENEHKWLVSFHF